MSTATATVRWSVSQSGFKHSPRGGGGGSECLRFFLGGPPAEGFDSGCVPTKEPAPVPENAPWPRIPSPTSGLVALKTSDVSIENANGTVTLSLAHFAKGC